MILKLLKRIIKKVFKNSYKLDYLCYNLIRGEYG